MTDAIDLTTEQRSQLSALLHRFLPGVAVWAYGSRVKWTARPNSDLDLVAFATPAQQPQIAELKDALDESNLPFPVDLHVWDDVPERFREIIRQEYVMVQEAKESESETSVPGEWREVAVEEIKAPTENALATGPFGSSIGSRFFTPSGIPVIRGSNLSEDIGTRLDDEGLVFLSPEKASEFSRSKVRDGDLIFTCWGTVNQVGLIDRRAAHREYIISNKQMKLTPDPAKADSLFLYYLFSSPELQGLIKNHAIGSSVPGFNLGQLRAMRIRLPELDEQRAIAHILGTLDDKIELNRRMNETLEAMTRALFKSWFVDFDPVRAKAEGCEPGLPKHLADLFPDSFEESELGEIPRGWEVKRLDEVADVNWGDTNVTKSAYTDQGFVAYSAKGPDGFLPYYDFDRVGIVVSAIGANSGFTWLARGKWSCIKNTIRLWATDLNISTEYLFFATLGNDFWPVRGSAQPFIAQGDARAIRILYPSDGIAQRFGEFTGPLFEKIQANKVESLTLSALRDTLLPKLVSGELRVKDAERFIEKTV